MGQGMVDEAFLQRRVNRLREAEPDALAVILKGSYARGDAGPWSDVDFDVFTAGAPRVAYPVYFDAGPGGRLVLVSVACAPLESWLAGSAEPFRPLNPPVHAGSQIESLRLVLDFPVAPPRYREDLLVCLGLTGGATTPQEVAGAARRLVEGALALLRPHARRLAQELQPYLPRYLADGTLERYLE